MYAIVPLTDRSPLRGGPAAVVPLAGVCTACGLAGLSDLAGKYLDEEDKATLEDITSTTEDVVEGAGEVVEIVDTVSGGSAGAGGQDWHVRSPGSSEVPGIKWGPDDILAWAMADKPFGAANAPPWAGLSQLQTRAPAPAVASSAIRVGVYLGGVPYVWGGPTKGSLLDAQWPIFPATEGQPGYRYQFGQVVQTGPWSQDRRPRQVIPKSGSPQGAAEGPPLVYVHPDALWPVGASYNGRPVARDAWRGRWLPPHVVEVLTLARPDQTTVQRLVSQLLRLLPVAEAAVATADAAALADAARLVEYAARILPGLSGSPEFGDLKARVQSLRAAVLARLSELTGGAVVADAGANLTDLVAAGQAVVTKSPSSPATSGGGGAGFAAAIAALLLLLGG